MEQASFEPHPQSPGQFEQFSFLVSHRPSPQVGGAFTQWPRSHVYPLSQVPQLTPHTGSGPQSRPIQFAAAGQSGRRPGSVPTSLSSVPPPLSIPISIGTSICPLSCSEPPPLVVPLHAVASITNRTMNPRVTTFFIGYPWINSKVSITRKFKVPCPNYWGRFAALKESPQFASCSLPADLHKGALNSAVSVSPPSHLMYSMWRCHACVM